MASNFERDLHRLVLEHGKPTVEDFFNKNFLNPLITQLSANPEIPAEELRQKIVQTQKIKNFILTLPLQ